MGWSVRDYMNSEFAYLREENLLDPAFRLSRRRSSSVMLPVLDSEHRPIAMA